MESTASAPKEDIIEQKTNDTSDSSYSSSSSSEVTDMAAMINDELHSNDDLSQDRAASPVAELQQQALKESSEEKDIDDTQAVVDITEGLQRTASLLVNTDNLDDVGGQLSIPDTNSTYSDYDLNAEITSPFLHFTHALREERNRSKLCLVVGSCMNEISHIEETFGKQILKVRQYNL